MTDPITLPVADNYHPPHPFKQPHVAITPEIARQIVQLAYPNTDKLRAECEAQGFTVTTGLWDEQTWQIFPDQPAPVAADKPAMKTVRDEVVRLIGPGGVDAGPVRIVEQVRADQPAGDDAAVEAQFAGFISTHALLAHFHPEQVLPLARHILYHIRRGEVPGIECTAYWQAVANRARDEVADLRAKLESAADEIKRARIDINRPLIEARDKALARVAELEREAEQRVQGNAEVRRTLLAELAAMTEAKEAWENRAIELAHDPKADARPVIEEWRAKAERAWSDRDAARAEADALRAELDALKARKVKLPHNGILRMNGATWYLEELVIKAIRAAGVEVE